MERQGEGRRPTLPPGSSHQGRAPVVMDDIATTGHALIAAAQAVHAAGWPPPTAVVVHALLQREDVQALHHAGVPRIASCNTIAHAASVIAVDDELADAVAEVVGD
jgi:ribose-phosphate pyrophosphokinase